ncbi:MAG TPA: CBS domain-containing protein [Acidocella sp.]|jgi:CBS domain-containing protein|nr:CBS domain-containing protein [Acidocella sp.]
MTLKSILKHKPAGYVAVAPDARVTDVLALLAEKHIGAVLVTDNGKLVGILSERDVVRSLAHDGAATLEMTAAALMTKNPNTATPDFTVTQAMALMTEKRFRHLPILEDGTLTGLVSIGDVVKAVIEQSQQEVETLRTYVAGAA